MFSSSISLLGNLAVALFQGDEGAVGKIVENKFERMGRDLLMNATPFGSALGVAGRFGEFLETGGMSELDRLGRQWLSGLRPSTSFPGSGILRRMQNAMMQTGQRRIYNWQRGGWATSRQDWLENNWRHNWRSQPRDLIGRWIPGRLSYPVSALPKVSRRVRRIRRIRNANRRVGRQAARGIVSSWGTDAY